ncbi:hypothetical protein ACFV6F_36955 [Kitasatospora phosalacinea]|uniref:hypothetical protein n=1 Tax=Kitasatospora phosalacinea TaxID=2065 RepID=UPI00364B69B7
MRSIAWAVLNGRPVLAVGSDDNHTIHIDDADGYYDSRGSVLLWDMSDPTAPVPLGQPLDSSGPVRSVAWAVPNGEPVLTVGYDGVGSVLLWKMNDPTAPVPLGQPLDSSGQVQSIA